MRHRRLNPLSGLFFNTGDRHEQTIDESFGFSRQYRDTVSEGLMEGERLENKKEALHRQEEEQKRQMNNPMPHHKQYTMHNPDQGPVSHQTCL
ncbi:hypothetical protein WG947_12835 [Pontibacter sp. H259]|uniref:hypothetical protein n=1 Tax=Pontibacter sp. H259 TaxID=3133421 RepID=UPI0030BB2D68